MTELLEDSVTYSGERFHALLLALGKFTGIHIDEHSCSEQGAAEDIHDFLNRSMKPGSDRMSESS